MASVKVEKKGEKGSSSKGEKTPNPKGEKISNDPFLDRLAELLTKSKTGGTNFITFKPCNFFPSKTLSFTFLFTFFLKKRCCQNRKEEQSYERGSGRTMLSC